MNGKDCYAYTYTKKLDVSIILHKIINSNFIFLQQFFIQKKHLWKRQKAKPQ